jgi:hypothetical protein
MVGHRVARFFLGATYQNGKNVPKWPQNIPNGHKFFQIAVKYLQQMAIKFTNIFLYYIDSPKFTLTGIFGLKIYHLATLVGHY